MRSGLGMRRLACIGLVRCLCELTARRTNQALWAPANWPHGRESGTRLAEQQYTWPHYCRGTNRYADRGAPTTGTASEPILTKGSAGLPTLADPSGSQHGWPSREQDVPFRFGAAQNLPHGTPDRYPAKPHDPEKRISRPGAASDSGRIGHFAGAAYAFLAKMVKMSSQSCRRRVRHPKPPFQW